MLSHAGPAAAAAFSCRPLGVLLDNVAQGWSYNTITWSDVATRDLASTNMVSTAAQHSKPTA